jgi:excisionase family DNA binding protein
MQAPFCDWLTGTYHLCYNRAMPAANPYKDHSLVRQPDGRDPSSLYLTVPQVAAMRCCHRRSVYNAIHNGTLPSWVLGDIYLIPKRAAEDWALRRPVVDTAGRNRQITDARRLRIQKSIALRAAQRGQTLPRPRTASGAERTDE